MKVKEVIDSIIKKTGMERLPEDKTCDLLMIGSYDTEVTKIVTTFMATVDVIKEAINIGANLIITHEPTWFTGKDTTDWLGDDPVFLQKKQLIEDNNIAIWRFHDHMHAGDIDLTYKGIDLDLDWGQYRIKNPDSLRNYGVSYQIPKTSIEELSYFFKDIFDMDVVQIVGDPKMPVERLSLLVGGGSLGFGKEEMPMEIMYQNDLDLIVCGEITEWTTSAYVRDASQLGLNKGMIVLGHHITEEPGMKYLVPWIEEIVGDIDVEFIDSKEPFIYL